MQFNKRSSPAPAGYRRLVQADGLHIRNMPQGRLSVGSNHIKHNTGNGITQEGRHRHPADCADYVYCRQWRMGALRSQADEPGQFAGMFYG
jgi:hypothetical protein